MLIVGRKSGERIFIGDDIILTIVKVDGNQVKIGIDAPREVAVHREEVYDRIMRDKTGNV